jgi:hypothetical protein
MRSLAYCHCSLHYAVLLQLCYMQRILFGISMMNVINRFVAWCIQRIELVHASSVFTDIVVRQPVNG